MSNKNFSFLRAQNFSKFEDVFQFLREKVSPKMVALFAIVAWSIWKCSNRRRERQKTWGIDAIFSWASELLKEFQDVNKKVPQVVARSEDIRWKPPAYGLYKINFDGALFADQACAGLGVVIRDSEGQIIGALS